MRGSRSSIHAAGRVTDWGPRREFFRVNAQGTANVVAACRAAGVRRLVHLGSLTVLGLPRGGGVVDETTPPADAPADAYTASRLSGERIVRAAHGEGGLETVVVRCGLIWGPGEPTILPRILALLRRGRMVYPGGGRNHLGMAYVDNLVEGVILAATAPAAAGRLYHITDGEEVTCREVLDAIAGALGVPPPRRSVPFPVIYAIAALLEGSRKPSAAPRRRRSPGTARAWWPATAATTSAGPGGNSATGRSFPFAKGSRGSRRRPAPAPRA